MKSIGNVFVLGDSYSTFKGYIPEGYATYYGEKEREGIDVYSVDETWWMQVIKRANGNLLMNCSWSGTTISHHGWENRDCKETSFIGRMEKLIKQGYFRENKVDTFLLFGGTNDSWINSPIGNLKYSDWTAEDLKFVLPAFCYLFLFRKQILLGSTEDFAWSIYLSRRVRGCSTQYPLKKRDDQMPK